MNTILIGIIAVAAIIAVGVIVYLIKNPPYFQVREQQSIVIERLGKFNRVRGPGLRLMWPFMESRRKFTEHVREGEKEIVSKVEYIDQRQRTADLPEQKVITRDKIELMVDSVAYYQITDPQKAMYSQKDVLGAINQKIKTELRNVIGDTDLQQLVRGQEQISQALKTKLEADALEWGITVRSVELQSVTPPASYSKVSEAEMELQRVRLQRQSEIEKAEGEKQAAILRAEGEAEKINRVFKAIHEGNPNDELLRIKYLEALEKIADGKATKVFMPFPSNPANLDVFQQGMGMAAGLDAYAAPEVQKDASEKKAGEQKPPATKVIRRVVKKPGSPSDSSKT